MTVDTYSVCPCGSGKKIKFCKCKDSVGMLDRVYKMVEGGQIVPALDRLSSILQEHPDAAWALAVRGRLFLELREFESLAENAERFIRLQPSNPLALTQRAAAKLFKGDEQEAVDSLLQALTESGREVDSFVMDVALIVAYSLVRGGVFLTARMYASLPLAAENYEGSQSALQLLRQLNSAPNVSHLLKAIPELIERPSNVAWGERYDEAMGLLRSNKVSLVQSKLESLQRTVPGEPAILSGLLHCAVWRGDAQAQSDLMRKISQCESLELEQRVRYRAMAAVVPPGAPEMAVEVLELKADVSDAEQVEMSMTADSRFLGLPSEVVRGFQNQTAEDDVPPRAAFQIIDADPPDTESLPAVESIPSSIGLALLYGKQTDRSARVEVHDVRRADLEQVRARLSKVVDDSAIVEQPSDPMPLLAAANPPFAMLSLKLTPEEGERLQTELIKTRTAPMIASLPFSILGGRSLAESAADEGKRFERTVVLRVIESYDMIASRGDDVIAKIYELAGIEPLPPLKLSGEQVETVPNEDLNRVDPSGLSGEDLLYLMQRSQQVSATPATRRFASALLEAELPPSDETFRLQAYLAMMNAAPSTGDALTWLEKAKAFCQENGVSDANLLFTEVNLRLQRGDVEGFQTAITTLTSKYGNEPVVMARLQQLLMSLGILRPDGSLRAAPSPRGAAGGPVPGIVGGPASGAAPAASGASGLWTPDAPASPPSSGGGKLWVPGMD